MEGTEAWNTTTELSCPDCSADCEHTGVMVCMFCGKTWNMKNKPELMIVSPEGCFCNREHRTSYKMGVRRG